MEYEHPGLIKYTLEKSAGGIIFQIFEQNETTRNQLGHDAPLVPTSKDAWSVGSSSYPDLSANVVWLRGSNKPEDNRRVLKSLPDRDTRDATYDRIVKGIAKWAALPQWDKLRVPVYQPEQLELW